MKNFKFDINGSKYEVDVKSLNGNLAEVEVNGNLYQVKIDDGVAIANTVTTKPVSTMVTKPTSAKAPTPTPNTKSANTANTGKGGSKSVKAPLPGSILKVNIEAGAAFKEGDILCVMESMKMENNITAETNGTIAKVCISVGATVMQDDVLFEFD
jgi:biotin carboxyl carrier protein